MRDWLELIAREGAYLILLCALGATPATLFARERVDGIARLALAPILGFCAGTCIATTVLYFFPAKDTWWMLIVLALASVGYAVRRAGLPQRFDWGGAAQIAVVVVAVAGPLSAALAHRDSVGPVAYYYTDVDGYVAEQDGAARVSIRDAADTYGDSSANPNAYPDRTQWNWGFLAWFDSNLDAAPLNANVNQLLGLGATETYSPFLIVLLLAGALAAFAAVRYATASPTWAAALTGALFGGPVFLELWFDSFQAAIIGISLLAPFAIALSEVLRSRRTLDLVLLALVLATVAIVYPLFLPVMLLSGGAVLAWLVLRAWRGGLPLRDMLIPALKRMVTLAGLIVVFNPVAIARLVSYYRRVLGDEVPLPRVPWKLPLDVLPGWLLQTRGFWAMPPLADASFKQLVLGALIPLALLPVIVLGLHRHRYGLALVVLGAVFAIVGIYSYESQDACTYCAERLLLPLAPLLAILLGLGVHALAARPERWGRWAALACAGLVVLFVGQRARVELTRFVNGSYFMDDANRAVLAKLPRTASGVHLEGYGQTYAAQAEQPLTYHLANEHVPGRVSVSFANSIRNSIQYLTFADRPAVGPEFKPGYTYVLTRFAGIDSGREVVARNGPIALERRTGALDVVPYAGLAAPLSRIDPSGTAWVQPTEMPLKFHVVGPGRGAAWVKLTLRSKAPLGTPPVQVPPQPGVRSRTVGEVVSLCVPVTGNAPIRDAQVQLTAPYVPGRRPKGLFPPPTPSEGLALVSMRAVEGNCAL